MAKEPVGSIYYTVESDTSGLLDGARTLDESLDRLKETLGKVDGETKKTGNGVKKLTKDIRNANDESKSAGQSLLNLKNVLATYITVRTLKAVVQMSDQYGQMASRIRNATRDTEEYEMVQARLLETANGTYRALSEAQEVYLATADTLRDLGYATGEVLDISDSLSYAFVRDAARSDQARTAMDAYSKALMKNKIEADGWASMMAATPSLVEGISQATGRSAEEIRKLGATGKLSVEALNEGLRQSRDVNKEFADSMEVAVADSLVKFRNSLSLFIGKINESSGASSILTDNIADFADILQDPAIIKAAQDLAGGVVAALSKIITTIKEVVEFSKWLGEELAATWHGAAADDIVRLEQQLEIWEKMLDNPLRRLRGDLIQGFTIFNKEEVEANIALTKKLIADFYAEQERLAKQRAKNAPPVVGQEGKTKDPRTGKVKAEAEETVNGRKKLTEAEKEAAKAARELAAEEQRNRDIIASMAQELGLAALKGEELAKAKGRLKLNPAASIDEVESAEALAVALWRAAEAQSARKKFGENSREADDYILGDRAPLSGGLFDDQYARYVEEEIAEKERYERQLERFKSAQDLQIETRKTYQDLEEQMAREHANRLAQIEMAKNTLLLSSGETLFSSLADAVETYSGKASNTYRTLFALSKGFAISNAAINLTAAISQAMADPSATTPAQKMANMAAIAAAGGSLVSQISSVSYGGGRQYGGGVAGGRYYRVNENGDPEMFRAANGQQYFLPNTAGQVISANEAGRGGASIQNIITIQISGDSMSVSESGGAGAEDAAALGQAIRTVVVDELERQNRPGGILWRNAHG